MAPRSRQIIVAGGGVAGLTAALAFAARGFAVRVCERSPQLEEVGAGLQLSPNATRLLRRLGLLDGLMRAGVVPPAVVLREAATGRELAHVPLGVAAEERWGAPYLAIHRADLQSILLAAVRREAEIELDLGTAVRDLALHERGVTVSVDAGEAIRDRRGLLCVGADGVHSTLRPAAGPAGARRFTGHLAWRRTIRADTAAAQALGLDSCVTAYLDRRFHLIAYPIRAGSAVNIVAFTRGSEPAEVSTSSDPAPLAAAMAGAWPALRTLAEDGGGWTIWPIYAVSPNQPWTAEGRLALIGDAAHALAPFAAQGAAMAIEDAVSLAACVAAAPDGLAAALPAWEKARRQRLRRVARRGAFNQFVWHAAGPAARARDLMLKLRPAPRLAADLDWLYGYDAQEIGRPAAR